MKIAKNCGKKVSNIFFIFEFVSCNDVVTIFNYFQAIAKIYNGWIYSTKIFRKPDKIPILRSFVVTTGTSKNCRKVLSSSCFKNFSCLYELNVIKTLYSKWKFSFFYVLFWVSRVVYKSCRTLTTYKQNPHRKSFQNIKMWWSILTFILQ